MAVQLVACLAACPRSAPAAKAPPATVSAAAYYGFILLVAFKGPWLGTKLAAGMTTSIGVPIGVGVIVFTIILTWIYVRRANGEFDETNAKLIAEAQK